MSKEAMKLALEALIGARAFLESDAPVEIWGVNDKAITALREALAEQPAQQWQSTADKCELEKVPANGSLLPAQQDYERGFIDGMQKQMQSSVDRAVNAMSQRTWVGLTDEERMDVLLALNWDKQLTHMDTAKSIEAKLRSKNT